MSEKFAGATWCQLAGARCRYRQTGVFLPPSCDRDACTNDGQADPRRVATSDRLINSLPETVETIGGSQTGSLHRASNFSGAVIVRDHCRDSEDKLGVANRPTPDNSCIRRWKSTLQALPEESDA